MLDKELGQIFDNNSDCITEVETDEPGYKADCDAMSKEKFIEVVSALINENNPKFENEVKKIQTQPESIFFNDWNGLQEYLGSNNYEIIAYMEKPYNNRKGDIYLSGKVLGFIPGLYGGGHYNYRNGIPMTFDSRRMHWLKEPKVMVFYNCFEYGKKQHSDNIKISQVTKFELKFISK